MLAARVNRDPRMSRPVRARPANAGRRDKILRTASSAATSGLKWIAWAVFQRPKQTLVTLLLTGVSVAVAMNALTMQTAPHPAPLFSSKPVARLADPVLPPARPANIETAAVAAEPEQRPQEVQTNLPQTQAVARASVERAATSAPAAASTTSVPVQPARAAPSAPLPPAAAPRDPIGALIRNDTAQISPEAKKTNMDGQRALEKLGYGPLTIDGVVGPGTKRAIEAFETSNRLPVTGEFGPKTMKALSERVRVADR